MSLEKILYYVEEIKSLESAIEQGEREKQSALEQQDLSYLTESDKISEAIAGKTTQIKVLEEKIAAFYYNRFMDKAYTQASSELGFWGIKNPAQKSNISIKSLEDQLKTLLLEQQHLNIDDRNKLEKGDLATKVAIEARHNEQKKSLRQRIESIILLMKVQYEKMLGNTVSNYGFDSVPTEAKEVPQRIAIGNVELETPSTMLKYGVTKERYLKLPYAVDLTDPMQKNGNLYVNVIDADEGFIERTIVGVMMKYLESFPKKKLRFGVFSPLGGAMSSLTDFYAGITEPERQLEDGTIEGLYTAVTPDICLDTPQLNVMLRTLEEQGRVVGSQIRASKDSSTLFDLHKNGIDFEPFHLIILQDVFSAVNGNRELLQRLYNCVKGGERNGFRFLFVEKELDEDSYNREALNLINKIKDLCLKLDLKGEGFFGAGDARIKLVNLEDGESPYDFMKAFSRFKEKASVTTYEQIGFEGKPEERAVFDLISIPVGTNGLRTWNLEFACEADAPIANMMLGLPKSGKSTMIDALILNGAMKYSPEDIAFQLIDFKEGISSSVYASSCKIPHLKMVSQNNTPEEAEILLNRILALNSERVDSFVDLGKEIGRGIPNIIEYNKWVVSNPTQRKWKKMPRVIVIVDECQHLFASESLRGICENILRMGRSQGIHIVLATQTPPAQMINAAQYIDGRYCFRVSESVARDWFSKPGEAKTIQDGLPLYAAMGKNKMGNAGEKIRIAFHNKKMEYYAQRICQRWNDRTRYPMDLTVIGDKTRLSVTEYKYSALFEKGNFAIPLGEDYEDHSIVSVQFKKEKQSAMLLLCGTEAGVDNVENMLISTLNCAHVNGIQAFVVDASGTKVLTDVCAKFGNSAIQAVSGSKYMETLTKVYQIYRTRDPEQKHPPIYFVVNMMQNISDITGRVSLKVGQSDQSSDCPKESDFDNKSEYLLALAQYKQRNPQENQSSNSSVAVIHAQDTLLELVDSGYLRDVYVCVSTDSLAKFDYRGSAVFQECNYKIITSGMSETALGYVAGDRMSRGLYASINENMAFLSNKVNKRNRFRVIKHQ